MKTVLYSEKYKSELFDAEIEVFVLFCSCDCSKNYKIMGQLAVISARLSINTDINR